MLAPNESFGHEGRISRLEEIATLSKQDRRDLWKSINQLRESLAKVDGICTLTLHRVEEILAQLPDFHSRIEGLAEHDAKSRGATRALLGVITLVGTVFVGIIEYLLTRALNLSHP